MRCVVTGGAGFVGSNLVDRLLQAGHDVRVYDSLCSGFKEFIHPDAQFVQGDLHDTDKLNDAVKGVDMVFHLAANADVRFGTDHPDRDLHHNTIGTFNVLEAVRKGGVPRIGFSSTGAIYGESEMIPTPENAPFPVQTSLYAASKLAGEGMIQAYAEGFGVQAFIYRFVSILGERYHHGHVYDFYKKLLEDPTHMYVLGNGTQKKSYLYVQDCMDAILLSVEKAKDKVNIFNLGTEEVCDVSTSIGYICERLGIEPELEFEGSDRGWVGDNPMTYLDCQRIRALGWEPKHDIRAGVVKTLEFLMENKWVLKDH